jgi:hypothetical protein
MQCADGAADDSCDRIVVVGVINGSDQGLFRVLCVARQDQQRRRSSFQQIGAGVPAVAKFASAIRAVDGRPDLVLYKPP